MIDQASLLMSNPRAPLPKGARVGALPPHLGWPLGFAMEVMAYIHLHGHIGRDPEVKSVGDTLVCTFPLADRARLRPRGEEREAQAQ